MEITFLGGTEEIGASAILVKTCSARILVDCGIRLRGKDSLPDLEMIEREGGLDAILLTHGHLDHIGALPVLYRSYPNVPVYATPPTIALARIMLRDAAKLMALEDNREEEIPLYSIKTVENLLKHIIPVQPDMPEKIVDKISATFFLCGHIIGASSIGIEGPDGRVLLTGDISWTDQMSVSGMSIPPFRPHCLVMESTYGNRLHANRSRQEDELALQVAETISGGGKVLIPAFAVGRAQEVLLILRRAIRLGRIPRFQVWVDGLVRPVCHLYVQYSSYLKPKLGRLIGKIGDPFFHDLDEIQPVTSVEERKKIIDGPPCVIVASSGMLSGGASVFYAEHLLEDDRSLITITGYQDEEAPGRKLVSASDGLTNTIKLNGREFEIKCSIKKYMLSAHADAAELVGLATRLKPSDTILVHGDESAREQLSTQLASEPVGRIHLPLHGQTLKLKYGKHTFNKNLKSIGNGRPLADFVDELAAHVLAIRGERASWQVAQLLRLWGEKNLSVEDAEKLLLESGFFQRNPARPFSVKLVSPTAGGLGEDSTRLKDPVALVVERFSGERGLYKYSVDRIQRHLKLRFHFPVIAEKYYREELDSILEPLHWNYTIHPLPHTELLDALVKDLIGKEGGLVEKTSMYLDKNEVIARIKEPLKDSTIKRICSDFLKKTGLILNVNISPKTCLPKKKKLADGRYEINAAFNAIEKSFASAPHKPYKKRLMGNGKNGKIELLFISPIVGERYLEKINELSMRIGWDIEVGTNPNQHLIKEVAVTLAGDMGLELRKTPSFFCNENLLCLQVFQVPPQKKISEMKEQFHIATGFDIKITKE